MGNVFGRLGTKRPPELTTGEPGCAAPWHRSNLRAAQVIAAIRIRHIMEYLSVAVFGYRDVDRVEFPILFNAI
jgi:hypothetical protein